MNSRIDGHDLTDCGQEKEEGGKSGSEFDTSVFISPGGSALSRVNPDTLLLHGGAISTDQGTILNLFRAEGTFFHDPPLNNLFPYLLGRHTGNRSMGKEDSIKGLIAAKYYRGTVC